MCINYLFSSFQDPGNIRHHESYRMSWNQDSGIIISKRHLMICVMFKWNLNCLLPSHKSTMLFYKSFDLNKFAFILATAYRHFVSLRGS